MANAIVERRFHTVESNVHAVMSDMAVPVQYFEEIWKGVVCIHNRLPDQLRERHPHPRPPITKLLPNSLNTSCVTQAMPESSSHEFWCLGRRGGLIDTRTCFCSIGHLARPRSCATTTASRKHFHTLISNRTQFRLLASSNKKEGFGPT